MNIIAADDELLALEEIVSILNQTFPYAKINAFQKAGDTIEWATNNLCEIAFLDIEMRDMDGLVLAKRLKQINPNINIIFVTGYSQYMSDAFELRASGYLLKPVTCEMVMLEVENLRNPIVFDFKNTITVKTFGNFEVYANNLPIKFQYSKTKELFAYLVDRNGAMCTNGEIMSILWEGDSDLLKRNSYFKRIRADLIKTLISINALDVLNKQRGCLGVIPEKINCDYYDWIDGKIYAINAYRGEYMSQYSWGEITHGIIE